jgi:hypothetical protein
LPICDERAGLAVRYAALQPVSFLVKDLNFILYSGRGDVRRWLVARELLIRLERAGDPQAAAAVLGELIGSTRARYLLVQSRWLSPQAERAVHQVGGVVAARGSWLIVAPRARAAEDLASFRPPTQPAAGSGARADHGPAVAVAVVGANVDEAGAGE